MTLQPEKINTAKKNPFFKPTIQKKLSVGSANDTYETEADAMANKVMRMQEPQQNVSHTGALVQRKCAHCEQEEKLRMKPLVESISPLIQKSPAENSDESQAPSHVENQINSSRGGGSTMDHNTKSFMESRFGTDFSAVKIHTGSQAVQMSRELNAQAFTVGNDVYFNEGKYSPNTDSGRHLLAHELTHTVQQSGGIGRKVQRLIRQSLVTCPVGQNPFSADRTASNLLTNAISVIDSAITNRPLTPTHADVLSTNRAMRAFNLNPANNIWWTNAQPQFGLNLIRRRIEIVRNYINSVVFTVTCGANGANIPITGCGVVPCNGPEAWSCHLNSTEIVLCPPFWALNQNQRARTFMHEVFHITFTQINDWDAPDSLNAHCYAQFVALINGFNSPAGFTCH